MILYNLHTSVYSSDLTSEVKSILKTALDNSFVLPSMSRIKALNHFIKKLKKEGIYQKLDGLWLGAYNDVALLNFTRINLVRPRNQIAIPGTTLVYNEKGWKGTGVTTSDFDTRFDYDTQNVNYLLGDSNVTAVVNDVSGVTTSTNSIISSAQTNGVDSFLAFNSTQHKQNYNGTTGLSSSVDLSGVGFKSFSKIGENCILLNKNVQSFRTQPNTSLPPLQLILLRMSTGWASQIGLSYYSIGGNLVGLESIYRQIINEYLVEIGLTAYA